MLFRFFFTALAAFASAQNLDWDLVAQLTPLPTPTVPVVYKSSANQSPATAVTLPYAESAVLSSVAAALSADPSDAAPQNPTIAKRATSVSSCVAQPTGAGPVPSPDTPSAFLSFSALASSATQAATPSGYHNVYTNLQAASNAYGYLGYTTLKSYNTQTCADKCTKIDGCQSFNIYFERDPSLSPDSPTCANPGSTTQIKCVFWGGPVSTSNAVNAGQYRNQFQVVITGSNGYVNTSLDTPPGYGQGAYLNNAVINATNDCNGNPTFINQKVFTGGAPFDPSLCAVACSTQNSQAWSSGQGSSGACRFFNTFILYNSNGQALGQSCMLYNETWTTAASQNQGYSSGNAHYTVRASYIFSNASDPGVCKKVNSSSSKSTFTTSTVTSTTSSVIATTTSKPITTSTTISTSSVISTTTSSSISSSTRTSTTSSSVSSISSSTSTPISSSVISTSSSQMSISSATISKNSSSTITSFTTSTLTTSTVSGSFPISRNVTNSSSTSTTFTGYSTLTNLPAMTSDTMAPAMPTVTPGVMLPTSTDINGIKPAPTHAMDFGHDNQDDTHFVFAANITAANGTTLVNMEKFTPFISSTSCGNSSIVLGFTTAEALSMAQSHWPSTFALMTSDAVGCGDGSGHRTFYIVSSVSFVTNWNATVANTTSGNSTTGNVTMTAGTATLHVTQVDKAQVLDRIVTQWGTINSTEVTGNVLVHPKAKRSGNDGSTSFHLDTSSFVEFAKGFAYGFDASYSAIVDMDPSKLEQIFIDPHAMDNITYNRVQCPGCGLTADVTLYGGYDWSWSGANFNYIKGGFRIQNAHLNVAFEIFSGSGYSADFEHGLEHVKLPGIDIGDLLDVNPTVSLVAGMKFDLSASGLNIANFGVVYEQQQDIWFEMDFINRHTSYSGWQNLAPTWLDPVIQNVPSELSVRASIGPAFGVSIGALAFRGEGEIGLDTPYFEADLAIRNNPSDVSDCIDYAFWTQQKSAIELTVTAGIEIYTDFDASFFIWTIAQSDKIEIASWPFNLGSWCWAIDNMAIDNVSWGPGFS